MKKLFVVLENCCQLNRFIMKRFSFVFAFMAFALFALSQSNYVYVEEAGTLDSLLHAFSLKDATQLTVEGKLNGSDIKTIRYINRSFDTVLKSVSVIDDIKKGPIIADESPKVFTFAL